MEQSVSVKRPIAECDAGDVAMFAGYAGWDASKVANTNVWGPMERAVIMLIKAPRGRLLVFGPVGKDSDCDDRKCEAIKAFVCQHSVNGGGKKHG